MLSDAGHNAAGKREKNGVVFDVSAHFCPALFRAFNNEGQTCSLSSLTQNPIAYFGPTNLRSAFLNGHRYLSVYKRFKEISS